jgi:hypothetical protein
MPHTREPSQAIPLLESLEPRALLSYTFFGPGPLFSPTPDPPSVDRTTNSVLADFDGDGIADLATATGKTISFAKGLPDGTFEANRTTDIGAPVGLIAAGRFDGTGRWSLVAAGTRGGSIDLHRPNPGFRLRAIAFDPGAHADINGATAGAFTVVTTIEVPDFHQHGILPTPIVGDMLSGWRDEFALNLTLPSGENRIAVYEFVNRSTIVRRAEISPGLPAYGLTAGDVLGTGKAQLVFANTLFVGDRLGGVYMQYYSTISVAAPSASPTSWSVTPVRTFPVGDLSFALGDWNNDSHTDIVAFATRTTSTPSNSYLSDSRLWLIPSLGSGAFAAPRALTERRFQGEWSIPPSLFEAGRPTLAGLADLNGDGRLDALIRSVSVFYYRINSYQLQVSAAIQSPSGAAEVVLIPTALAQTSGSAALAPFGVKILPPQSAGQPPSILVGGLHLIRAVTPPQAPVLSEFAVNVTTPNLIAQFFARAFDADQLRGGSIQRVEYYIDLNHDNQIDDMDIHVGDTTSRDEYSFYTLTTPLDASWSAGGNPATVLARAVDDTGAFSEISRAELYL